MGSPEPATPPDVDERKKATPTKGNQKRTDAAEGSLEKEEDEEGEDEGDKEESSSLSAMDEELQMFLEQVEGPDDPEEDGEEQDE